MKTYGHSNLVKYSTKTVSGVCALLANSPNHWTPTHPFHPSAPHVNECTIQSWQPVYIVRYQTKQMNSLQAQVPSICTSNDKNICLKYSWSYCAALPRNPTHHLSRAKIRFKPPSTWTKVSTMTETIRDWSWGKIQEFHIFIITHTINVCSVLPSIWMN